MKETQYRYCLINIKRWIETWYDTIILLLWWP